MYNCWVSPKYCMGVLYFYLLNMAVLLLLFNNVLEALGREIRQGKSHPNWKGRSKLSFFFRLPKMPRDAQKHPLELISKFNKVSRYNINVRFVSIFQQ